jgi:hypothetical protein
MLTFKAFLKEELKKTSGALGSNEGGVYQDTKSKKKYYMKFYENPDQAKSEVLSAKIHEFLGGKTLSPKYVKHEGKHGVMTEWNPNLKNVNTKSKLNHTQKKQIAKLYHASVLTKNWDLVGLEHDNLGINTKTGHVHIQDTGGSFNFRAQGGHKNYDKDIREYHSLRDHDTNHSSATLLHHAFGDDKNLLKSAHKPLTKTDHAKIYKIFAKSNVSNWKDLHANFVERSKKLDKIYS